MTMRTVTIPRPSLSSDPDDAQERVPRHFTSSRLIAQIAAPLAANPVVPVVPGFEHFVFDGYDGIDFPEKD